MSDRSFQQQIGWAPQPFKWLPEQQQQGRREIVPGNMDNSVSNENSTTAEPEIATED